MISTTTTLVIGRTGCGKTVQCLKAIESYIESKERMKQKANVMVVTDTTGEYEKLKSKGVKVLYSESSGLEDELYKLQDSFLVVDSCRLNMDFKNRNLLATLLSASRTKQNFFYLIYQSFDSIESHKILENADYIYLFRTNPIKNWSKLYPFEELLVTAQTYADLCSRYESVLINLDERKIIIANEFIFPDAPEYFTNNMEFNFTQLSNEEKEEYIEVAEQMFGKTITFVSTGEPMYFDENMNRNPIHQFVLDRMKLNKNKN